MKGRSIVIVGIVALGALLLTACGGSDTTVVSSNQQTGINVQGQGIAYGAPDIVDIDIGVQSEARTVADARAQAAQSMDAVVASLKANGVAAEDIRTVEFNVQPRYSNPGTPGGVSVIIGYNVSNVASVRIRKLDTAGKVIDDASAAGGNNTVVRRIQFGILDQTKLQTQARELAVKDAKDRGDKLAALNSVRLGKAIQINESFGNSPPIVNAPRTGGGIAAQADFVSAIETGQLRVVVNVSVNYEIER